MRIGSYYDQQFLTFILNKKLFLTSRLRKEREREAHFVRSRDRCGLGKEIGGSVGDLNGSDLRPIGKQDFDREFAPANAIAVRKSKRAVRERNKRVAGEGQEGRKGGREGETEEQERAGGTKFIWPN